MSNDRRWVEQLADDIDRRIGRRVERLVAQTRLGIAFGDPDAATRTIAVRLGGAADPSPGFVYGREAPRDGDLVRVLIDPRGDRWVDEVLGRNRQAAGTLVITPTAANTPTSAAVTFDVPGALVGLAMAETTAPETSHASITGITDTGATIWLTRTTTTATTVHWLVQSRG